ncbi:MAG: hypothetical protein Q7S27_07545, partial [Nanoarchaeota archaeon]|nr:hypothetical protein [Nanoarchaeota archaeon]
MVDKEEDYNWEKRYKEWKEIQSKLPESPVKEAPFYPNPEYDNKSIVEKTIASLKEDSQMFKEKIEQAEQSIEKALDLNNRPKLKLTLTILAYAIPAIILVGLLYYIFQPAINAESNIYNLDIGIKGDDSSRKALFLEKSKALSPHVLYGKETYREIIKTTPFEISFKSPVVIPPSSFVVLSLDVIGTNSNLYLNNTLVFPNLENYEFFKDLPDGYLFKKKSLTSDYLYEKDTLEEFLKENYYGTTIYSYIPLESEPIIENYAPTETFINNSFRNNLKFLFYTENSINLNFKKEDLNWYEGEDNYTVYIKDMDENIIYSEFLEDDFDATASNIKGFQQEHNLYFPGLKGVYYLIFENNGKSSDSTIKNIRINTNKIVYYRNFLVLNPMQFYIKNYFNKGLRFY